MAEINWTQLLSRWNDHVLASPLAEKLSSDVRSSGWIGFPPATDQQIAATEKRLRITLPPSYCKFLKASNGWRMCTHSIERMWGVDEVKWLRTSHRDWIDAFAKPTIYGPEPEVSDVEYFAYGQLVEQFRGKHFNETLQISEVGDAALYLLNPQVISKDGEWEAWFFANWIPGAHRYRSFAEMIEAEFSQFAGLDWKQPIGVQESLPDEYIGAPGSVKRQVKKRKKPRQEKLFGKPLNEWSVDELLEMLEREDFNIIHGEVIMGLGKLGDRRAVQPLLDILPENLSAIAALKLLAPELLTEPLLELLRRRSFLGFHQAAMLLSEMEEMKAVPLIVEAVKDLRPREAHLNECVAQHLAAFGSDGFDALVELLQHKQAAVRCRAVNGMIHTNKARAADALRPMLDDPDSRVREIVKIALAILPVNPSKQSK